MSSLLAAVWIKNNGHIAQFYSKDTENSMLLNMLLTLHSCDKWLKYDTVNAGWQRKFIKLLAQCLVSMWRE